MTSDGHTSSCRVSISPRGSSSLDSSSNTRRLSTSLLSYKPFLLLPFTTSRNPSSSGPAGKTTTLLLLLLRCCTNGGAAADHGVMEKIQEKSPSVSQVVAVLALFPVGGTLLTLSGVTLTGTLIGLALLTPLFLLFSPVLFPAAILVALSVAGFLASGAFGLTALSSFSWLYKQVSGKGGPVTEQIEHVKRQAQEATGQLGQRAREAGQGRNRGSAAGGNE